MAALAPQTFHVTPEVFEKLKIEANQQGIAISGDQGQVTQHGVTISWDYHLLGETLTLDCLAHTGMARFVSDESIARRITALVTGAGGTVL
jgi:hypothetical protein